MNEMRALNLARRNNGHNAISINWMVREIDLSCVRQEWLEFTLALRFCVNADHVHRTYSIRRSGRILRDVGHVRPYTTLGKCS